MSQAIADSWASFRANVIPADACDIQLEEMRLAFFSGALVALTELGSHGQVEPSQLWAEMYAEVKKESERYLRMKRARQ